MAEGASKTNVFKWMGVLAEANHSLRVVLAVAYVVASVALVSTKLAFIPVHLLDGSIAHIAVFLLPVALGALLLGTVAGLALGVWSGVALYLHATLLPLDYFEFAYVTPLTSIVLTALIGLLLGILFALFLRSNPSRPKRYVLIAVACVIVSPVYSGAFALFAQSGLAAVMVLVDAVLMSAICIGGDWVAERSRGLHDDVGMRTLFGTWMSFAVIIAFMISGIFSYATITMGELDKAERDTRSEVNYLCYQLGRDVHASPVELLTGYSIDTTGYVVLAQEGDIVASDDAHFALGTRLDALVDEDVLAAIEESARTGEMKTIVFEDPHEVEAQARQSEPQLSYLIAGQSDVGTVFIIHPSSVAFAERPAALGTAVIMAGLLLIAMFFVVYRLLNNVIARRIDETNSALSRITAGELDAKVEAGGTREFTSLSEGINETVDAMKGWITEAETRMDAELATAKAIQESALPQVFPPYPDIMRFDIYATMNAARQVGGDFYDFFLIGETGPWEGKLGFVLADVSGKGVPAALFMMNAKAQIRDYLEGGVEVSEAVENANRELCAGNDAGMFVTAWVGVLDYGTGHIEYVNAGHNPPLLWQHKGGWRWLTEKSGLPLGLFDGLPYKAHSIDCQVGEELLLYTDGVTEAMSVTGELYGEGRLEALVRTHYALHPRGLVNVIRQDVARHAQGAEQSDDITMLALEIGVPPEVTATMAVRADIDELPRVNEFIHAELDRRHCPKRAQNQLDIAVEELFVNVAHYAYPDATPENPGTAYVSYTYSAEPPSITVDIVDEGAPFNPLAKPDAVTPDDIEAVPIGGLGILMAKRSVSDMTYERVDGRNIVSIVKKW